MIRTENDSYICTYKHWNTLLKLGTSENKYYTYDVCVCKLFLTVLYPYTFI